MIVCLKEFFEKLILKKSQRINDNKSMKNYPTCKELTLCILMDYSFMFDTNKLGKVHCTYQGVSGYNSKKILYLSEDHFYLSKQCRPDEMQHNV